MNWRKSSYSQYNGNCVEVSSGWRKASYSMNNGNCVEAASGSDMVAVRDTTDRGGVTLAFTADTWTRFLRSIPAA
jgi:hypothetical protein